MSTYIDEIVAKGDLVSLLLGSNQRYRIPAPAKIPTDSGEVFYRLEQKLLNDENFRIDFQEAMLEAAKDRSLGFMTMYYLFDIFGFEKQHGLPLMNSELLSKIGSALLENKLEFEGSQEWEGLGRPNGLWGLIESLDTILERNYSMKVLPNR
jgi:hypothetical protein